MKFNKIINLIYVRGYFKSQPTFLNDLLKASVNKPEEISLSDSALKGYFNGNNITSLAPALTKAELNAEKLSRYIQTLYENEHKDSKTYNERFGNKKFKQVLYEKVKGKFDDITIDNMSDILSENICNIMKVNDETLKCDTNTIEFKCTFTDMERKDIKGVIKLINLALNDIALLNREIINNNTNTEKLKKSFTDKHTELKEHCKYFINLYGNKKQLHSSLKNIYEIAESISHNYLETIFGDESKYYKISLIVSNFNKYYEIFLKNIDKL